MLYIHYLHICKKYISHICHMYYTYVNNICNTYICTRSTLNVLKHHLPRLTSVQQLFPQIACAPNTCYIKLGER